MNNNFFHNENLIPASTYAFEKKCVCVLCKIDDLVFSHFKLILYQGKSHFGEYSFWLVKSIIDLQHMQIIIQRSTMHV